MPPMRGMLTSMRMTSGMRVLVFHPSTPSCASPTMSSFVFRIARQAFTNYAVIIGDQDLNFSMTNRLLVG